MFHESRVPGGRLSRKLSVRLTGLINQAVEASGAVAFLRAGFSGTARGSAMMAKMVQFSLGSNRPRLTQQVAQAYLDDLASSPRNGDRPLPLARLSDFARRNGSSEVSMTLAELFTAEGTTLLTVLDPRFHPGVRSLSIRIVSASNQEARTTERSGPPVSAPLEGPLGARGRHGQRLPGGGTRSHRGGPRRQQAPGRPMDPRPRLDRRARGGEGRAELPRRGQVRGLTDRRGQFLVDIVAIHDARQHGLREGALQDRPARVGS